MRRRRRCTAAGAEFREERAFERPLNVYGYSKLLFDQPCAACCRERDRARSRAFATSTSTARASAQGPHGVGRVPRLQPVPRRAARCGCSAATAATRDGEQRRDFVRVDDVVAVNLWFLEQRGASRHLQRRHRPRADLQRRRRGGDQRVPRRATSQPRAARSSSHAGLIEYIPFPGGLVGKYQSFTAGGPVAAARGGLSRRVQERRAGRRRLRERAEEPQRVSMKRTIEDVIGNTPLVRLLRLPGSDRNVMLASSKATTRPAR